MTGQNKRADVCLILEGTYPYVQGGVSTWTHDLIKMQSHLTFEIVTLLASGTNPELKYELPENVTGITHVYLQELPKKSSKMKPAEIEALFAALEKPLTQLQFNPKLEDLHIILTALAKHKNMGSDILLDSPQAWDMLQRMYNATMPAASFIDYFWSWRGLLGSLYSTLLFQLPEASAYHALCTGYAGVTLARARLETGRPCLVTEHGIYTNERRIEIASADWLEDRDVFNLSVSRSDKNLKDFWISMFAGYSKLCYEASEKIITLYSGNQNFQRMDGAPPEKMAVIPNGVDVERFAALSREEGHPPSIALLGRVVPIKDIKTYLKAVDILRRSIPDLRAYVLGPYDEDPAYYRECQDVMVHLDLARTVLFMGKVQIEHYFPRVDVLVLTSISEAQPLSILEAGAAGIPTVATHVGACAEMILGAPNEKPRLGPGGCISALADPPSTAAAIEKLLTDKAYYERCRIAIRERVNRYYNKKDQYQAYANLYNNYVYGMPEAQLEQEEYAEHNIIGADQEAA
jgi:glycosyltransferase involved in cell wall biosynthesis